MLGSLEWANTCLRRAREQANGLLASTVSERTPRLLSHRRPCDGEGSSGNGGSGSEDGDVEGGSGNGGSGSDGGDLVSSGGVVEETVSPPKKRSRCTAGDKWVQEDQDRTKNHAPTPSFTGNFARFIDVKWINSVTTESHVDVSHIYVDTSCLSYTPTNAVGVSVAKVLATQRYECEVTQLSPQTVTTFQSSGRDQLLVIVRFTQKGGKLWVRMFPDKQPVEQVISAAMKSGCPPSNLVLRNERRSYEHGAIIVIPPMHMYEIQNKSVLFGASITTYFIARDNYTYESD